MIFVRTALRLGRVVSRLLAAAQAAGARTLVIASTETEGPVQIVEHRALRRRLAHRCK